MQDEKHLLFLVILGVACWVIGWWLSRYVGADGATGIAVLLWLGGWGFYDHLSE